MCTAITYKTEDFYFGRTLDFEHSFGEEIVITPRNYSFNFTEFGELKSHFAIIGVAKVENGYPLYFDAINEKGLCVAGLNFVGNAVYFESEDIKTNLAQFELIPYLLGKCSSVKETKKELEKINITKKPFSENLPVSQLHWMFADRNEAITVESVADGLKIYENAVGVLANNPPFDKQLFNLNNYLSLSAKQPENTFSKDLSLNTYSRGMGALGLPGDLSSQSRFVRAAFTKLNSVSTKDEEKSVSQFFHILGTVSQTMGCCDAGNGEFEITLYTSCYNANKGVLYYTTYYNQQISAVEINKENLNGEALIKYPFLTELQIKKQN